MCSVLFFMDTGEDILCFFFFQAEDGIRDADVTGVQTCALPIYGLVARAGVADDDAGLAALGVAWAEMIGRGQRAADHYSWRLALGTALDHLAALPAWRGHTSTAETAMTTAK